MIDNSYISSIFKSIGIMINEGTKQEIMYYFPLVYDEKKSVYEFKNSYSIVTQPLGTFFTDFLNTDFEIIDDFKDLFMKYPFIILGSDYKKYNSDASFSEDEFKIFMQNTYSKKKSKLIRIQEQLDEILDYCIINPRKRKVEYTPLDRFLVLQSVHENFSLFRNNKMEVVTFYKVSNNTTANKSEDELYKLLEDKNNKVEKYYTYIPENIESLIYYILSNIIENKLQLKVCKNCENYFVTSNSKINYCDNIAPGYEQTCKEIGSTSSFKTNVENDELLKRYYKLYSKKAMMARRNPDIIEYTKDLNNYKKYGKNKLELYKTNKISAEDFNNWMNNKDK